MVIFDTCMEDFLMDILRLEIVTRQERNSAITALSSAISSLGGWIVNHHLYSNAFASINFVIDFNKIDPLIAKLESLRFETSIINDCDHNKEGEINGGIAIRFIHNEPDLKREVPPFG